jgi:ankyrin repeat protein
MKEQHENHIFNTLSELYDTEDEKLKRIKAIIAEYEFDVDVKNDDGETFLHRACYCGYLNIARFFIGKGADIRTKDMNGYTPLHIACYRYYSYAVNKDYWLDFIEFLIEFLINRRIDRRVGINIKDRNGRTPLHMACEYGDLSKVKYLIDNGADVKAPANNRETPFGVAKRKGHTEIVNMLLERERRSGRCRSRTNLLTALAEEIHLREVCSYDYSDVVQMLDDNKISITVIDKFENALLNIVVQNDHTDGNVIT